MKQRIIRPPSGYFNSHWVIGALVFFIISVPHSGSALRDGSSLTDPDANETQDTSIQNRIENLRAFTKLYGYVRYFHPSDQAGEIDWDRFAIYGVQKIMSAENSDDLRTRLIELFQPVAPTVQIYSDNEPVPDPNPILTPEDNTGLEVVTWQHLGVNTGSSGPYQSIRLNRPFEIINGTGFGTVIQRVDALPYLGKEIKLEAMVKADVRGSGNQAQLWLRVDRPENVIGFFDNMQDRPITSTIWQKYEITGTVADDAVSIVLGGFLIGSGSAWFDDFQLFVRDSGADEWSPVPLINAGFEEGENAELPSGWYTGDTTYRYSNTDTDVHEGVQALSISSTMTTQMATPLFEEHAAPGEVVERSLGRGLNAQIPLALYSRSLQTLQPDDTPPLNSLEEKLQDVSVDDLTAEDESLRYANVVISWNIFQHFYPYFDVVDVNWDSVLRETLLRATDDRSAEDFLSTLNWMVAQLDDGHGYVNHSILRQNAGLPFQVNEVEEKVIITAISEEMNDSSCVALGDIVVSVNGVPSQQLIREAMEYISGSPQRKIYRALREFGRDQRGTQVSLVLDRESTTVSCEVVRNTDGLVEETRPDQIEMLKEGIYYVDLDRASVGEINSVVDELAAADGVIFDLRGYPNGNHAVLQHLTVEPLRSAHWQKPQRIYPDQMELVGYDTSGRWTLPPTAPFFSGKIVFLTNARAISYAESVLGIVEHYELGEIVGQPTAGANGNTNPFTLPGGYSMSWTGMRVIKHDNSQHHLVGIQPTMWVERTIEGVRAGRDEYLEKALELIEASPTN